MNYFELFDLTPGFFIDPVELNKKYILLQKKYHPDFFGQSSDEEKKESLELSSEINKAYLTFKNMDKTIEYLLRWKGIMEEGEQYKLPPDFLMEVMELNEAKMDGVDETVIRQQAERLLQEIYQEVEPLLISFQKEEGNHNHLSAVKDYYYKKKYIDRLLAE